MFGERFFHKATFVAAHVLVHEFLWLAARALDTCTPTGALDNPAPRTWAAENKLSDPPKITQYPDSQCLRQSVVRLSCRSLQTLCTLLLT